MIDITEVPVNIEANYGQLLESDGEVEGRYADVGLDVVVAVEVADHDDPAKHCHVLQDCGRELSPHTVPEDVHLFI